MDVDTQGMLGFPDGRRLLLSCGFRRSLDRFARLLGSNGQIHITSPFHPEPEDRFTVFAAGQAAASHSARGTEPAFTAAIRHIHAVLGGTAQPRYLAVDTALGNARALHDLRASASTRTGLTGRAYRRPGIPQAGHTAGRAHTGGLWMPRSSRP